MNAGRSQRDIAVVSSSGVTARRLAPLLLLLAYGLAFGAAAFGLQVPAFDDHPGQLYRLWHITLHGPAPWAWNPGWWAGYPELQFYPPGFFYLGWALHTASLGLLSVPRIYQLLLWLAYLAPGLSTFVVLGRLLSSPWLALPVAFVALTLSAGLSSGVEGGVHIGMLPARLGWALLPLLLLTVTNPAGEHRVRWAAAPLLALIALMHPAHLPTGLAIIVLGVVMGPRARRSLTDAGVVVGLAAALTAFWTLPLLARLEHTRALAWGSFTPWTLFGTLGAHPLLAALALLALALALDRRRPRTILGALPWVMAGVVIADATVLDRLGVRWLPADRVADGMWLALVLGAGSGLDALLRGRSPRVVLAVATLAWLTIVGLALPAGTLSLWPRPADWPSLAMVSRGLRLPDLWAALQKAPPGRVLFVRSGVPLAHGTEWWRPHTHVTALTPVMAGREIVHGTFTHPSPLAALVYRGDPGPGAITTLAERLDGHSLFGRPLADLDAAALEAYADRLGLTAIVVLDEDLPLVGALREARHFLPRPPIGPFHIWERQAPSAVPIALGGGQWRVRLVGEPGAWAPARLAYFPLWTATRAGQPLETRRGPLWDLEIKLDAGDGAIELAYGPGPAEWAGVAVTAAAMAAGLVAVARRRRAGVTRA
jgi:hypothetical protein